MASSYFATLRSQLDTELRDADNFTFTSAEKDEALRKAIENDPDCYTLEVDSTNTTVSGTVQYTTPYFVTVDVGYDALSDGYVEFLPRDNWEQIGDQVILSSSQKNLLAGKTLYLYGANELSKTGAIPQQMRTYIVNQAVIYTIDMLLEGKINRFLRNDTTLAEMQQVRANRQNDNRRLRNRLNNRRNMRF